MNIPTLFQRIEGAAVFTAATFVFFDNGFSWLTYVLLLFVFDVFMLGYAANPRIGAVVYNAGHSFIAPALITILYAITDTRLLLGLACLWFAHIGIDRALGYGLKFASGFKHTHLGDIGKNQHR